MLYVSALARTKYRSRDRRLNQDATLIVDGYDVLTISLPLVAHRARFHHPDRIRATFRQEQHQHPGVGERVGHDL
jgi:hypothetical protein